MDFPFLMDYLNPLNGQNLQVTKVFFVDAPFRASSGEIPTFCKKVLYDYIYALRLP